ncbi:MAG TPA: lytic transglycosylase domain-containing protein [Candidatus Acidoferrales bacterium]|nr:lytic transglycosylase domain-containing protein [Candidatus Acidoferrales bacterium]
MSRLVTRSVVLAAVAGILAAAPAARADWALLRNGQRLHINGYERSGASIVLHLAGGEATVPAADVVRVEPEDVFAAATPAPTVPSGSFGPAIADAAMETGLDGRLLAGVIHAESNFQPRAVSPKGALGLMQLMPATARRLAVRDPFDPGENVRAGASYLKQLLRQFGDLNLALAAYNAGPERVSLYRGIPPFPETRDYISRVRNAMRQEPGRSRPSHTTKVVCSPLESRCRAAAATSDDGFPLP